MNTPKPTNLPRCAVCNCEPGVLAWFGSWVACCSNHDCVIGSPGGHLYSIEHWIAEHTPHRWILLDPKDETTWPPDSDVNGNDPQVILATYYDDPPNHVGFDLSPDFASARAMRKFLRDKTNAGYGLNVGTHIWQFASLPDPKTLKKEHKDDSN